jgi:hypothetical protein
MTSLNGVPLGGTIWGSAVAEVYLELDTAITDALLRASDQTDEFKRRLRRLIENSITSNSPDADVRDVIELATVDDRADD